MARKLIHDGEQPFVIDEGEPEDQGGTVAVCRCGRSVNKPYCGGSRERRETLLSSQRPRACCV